MKVGSSAGLPEVDLVGTGARRQKVEPVVVGVDDPEIDHALSTVLQPGGTRRQGGTGAIKSVGLPNSSKNWIGQSVSGPFTGASVWTQGPPGPLVK